MRNLPLFAVPALMLLATAACDDDPLDDDEEFFATLTVDAEVPPVQVETNASGNAQFEFDDDDEEMAFEVDVSNMTGVIAAHIHGPATTTEPAGVLVTLFTGPSGGTGDVDGELTSGTFVETDVPGTVSMDSLLVLMRNGRAYVNVHTLVNPAGEIRGQIEED